MSWDEIDEYESEDHPPGPGDDPAVQELEPQLVALLDANPERVFYETQLAVMFEKNFFHWVTSRALKDLRESSRITSELERFRFKCLHIRMRQRSSSIRLA